MPVPFDACPLALFEEVAKAHPSFRHRHPPTLLSATLFRQPLFRQPMAENPVPVCAVADVPVNGVISREIGDELVAIYNIDGVFYAPEARCTHGLADLADGTLEGDTIECSFHFGA